MKQNVKVDIVFGVNALRGRNEMVLIEEYFRHRELPSMWHAAVATPPFRIVKV